MRTLGLALAFLALLLAQRAQADSETCLKAHETAQIERMHGRYVEAHAQLLECAQAGCPGGVRNDCKGWLAEVEASLPSLVFAVSDAAGRDLIDVRISASGTLLSQRADGRSLALNPGLYNLRFEASGYVPQEQQVLVREAEKQRIVRITLQSELKGVAEPSPQAANAGSAAVPTEAASPAAQRSRRLLLSSYVLGGAAAVSLATAIGFGVSGYIKLGELEDQGCEPDCPPGEADSGKRRYVIADVAFAAAGAFGISAAITLLLGLRGKRSDRPPPAQVAVGRNGASLHWSSAF